MTQEQKPSIREELTKPLPPEAVQQRPDGFSYIDQTYVVPEANRLFGYDGWSCEVMTPPHIIAEFTRDVEEWTDTWEGEGKDRKKAGRKKTGAKITNHVAVVVCTVRVTVAGVHKDGEGACTAEAPIDSYANALETAFKGAVTDGMKRAFILLGERFGLGLYERKNKGRAARGAGAKPDPKAVFDEGVKKLDAAVASRASAFLARIPQCGDKVALAALLDDVAKDPAVEVIKPLLRPTVDAQKRKLGIGPRLPERPAGPDVFPNYGKAKGQPIAGASAGDLDYYAAGCKRSLDNPEKANFHDKERALLAVIEWEQQYGDAAQASQKAA